MPPKNSNNNNNQINKTSKQQKTNEEKSSPKAADYSASTSPKTPSILKTPKNITSTPPQSPTTRFPNSNNNSSMSYLQSSSSIITGSNAFSQKQQKATVAKWTIAWFFCAGLAASLLLAAEAFQDYRPAFPLEPVCATAFLLHGASALFVIRIGMLRWHPHFVLWQPFAGGVTFVSTQIIGYTFWSAATVSLYLYFAVGYSSALSTSFSASFDPASLSSLALSDWRSIPQHVSSGLSSFASFYFNTSNESSIDGEDRHRHGPLAIAGIFSAFGNWVLLISIQYFGVSQVKRKKSYSMASNEARAALVLIIVQLILTGATQWNHEKKHDGIAKALGFILLISHVLTAFVSYVVFGSRHVPDFSWFNPFSGSIRDIVAQALSWTAFSAAVLGFRVMMMTHNYNIDTNNNSNNNNAFEAADDARIGWGSFGAIGVAGNIGLFLQMRMRIRKYHDVLEDDTEKAKISSNIDNNGEKQQRSSSPSRSSSTSSSTPSSAPTATDFLATNARFVLTGTSVIIALFGIFISTPPIDSFFDSLIVGTLGTSPRRQDWFAAFRILLQCQITFPLVTHVTGVLLRAYNVRNPFASSLVGGEFIALQLSGWASHVGSVIFGLVLPHNEIADQWTSCLALLSQILIAYSMSLLDSKRKHLEQQDEIHKKNQTKQDEKAESPRSKNLEEKSTLQQVLSTLPIRGLDEMFNGLFLTGLVGCTLSILLRAGCDMAVHFSLQQQMNAKNNNNTKSFDARQVDLPLPVLVTVSTIVWAFCVPLLQISIVGWNKPFQGSPLFAALQALGWATYLFILVLLSLISVDYSLSPSQNMGGNAMNNDINVHHHQYQYNNNNNNNHQNSLQFTSQGALMIIPVFLITVSAFFSSNYNADESSSQNNASPQRSTNSRSFTESTKQVKIMSTQQEIANAKLSEEDVQQVMKLKQETSSATLIAALDNLLVSHHQQEHENDSIRSRSNSLLEQFAETKRQNTLREQQKQQQSSPSVELTIKDKGNDLAATIVFVACLSIASLALFVAAEHMGNSYSSSFSLGQQNQNNQNIQHDLRAVIQVSVLGVAALVASGLGCVAAHCLIGPTLHGEQVYAWWMPFQGGTTFVAWQVTGFGSFATAILLFVVDVLRRYDANNNSNNNKQQNYSISSTLVPSGLLSGVAPLIVLGSTFTFNKARTALDQPGSILYENAEATLSIVVLSGSWFLTATSELWLRNEWELATIPLFFGSIAALVVLPVGYIAIQKSAAQARFHRTDVIDADLTPDELERQEKMNNKNNNNNSNNGDDDDDDDDEDYYDQSKNNNNNINLNQPISESSADSFSSSNYSSDTDRESNPDDGSSNQSSNGVVNRRRSSSKKSKTRKIALGIMSAFKVISNAPLILLEVVFLILCGFLPLALIYGSYHLYNNYSNALDEIVQGFQVVVVAVQVILVFIFYSYGLLSSFTAAAGAFVIYSVPLFLASFVASFPLARPYNSAAWWMFVELVLGMAPPFWMQPVLTIFDTVSLSLCLKNAWRLWQSDSDGNFFDPKSYEGGFFGYLGAYDAGSLFLGTSPFMSVENAFYFSLLLVYKFRFLQAPETTGAKRSTFVLTGLQKWIIPGATRYFNLRVLVHGVDNKTGLKEAIRHDFARGCDLKSNPTKNDQFYKSWAKDSINAKQGSTTSTSTNNKSAVFGYHPHGIFAFTVPWFANSKPWLTAGGGKDAAYCIDEVKIRSKEQEDEQNIRSVHCGVLPRITSPYAANIVFNVPTMRDCAMWFGGRAATKTAISHALIYNNPKKWAPGEKRNPISPIIVPGGQAELIESRSQTKSLTLIGYHLGFLKLAVQHRTSPCPIMGFGENDILDNVHCPDIQRFFLNRAGFPFPIVPLGFLGFTWLPKKVALTPVVGRAVDLDAVWKEVREENKIFEKGSLEWPTPNSQEEDLLVKAVAKYYYEELKRIFYGYREEAGYKDMELNLLMEKPSKNKQK